MHEAHVEKKDSIFKIAINLTLTCLISGVILASAYYITHPIAVEKEKELTVKAMQSLVPDATTFAAVEGEDNMTAASDGSKVIAYIVEVEPKGYGGAIVTQVAVTPDGKVINYKITKSNETPGLGENAKNASFMNQFAGKTSEQLVVTKDTSKTDNIQAMTGATITSKAVTKGVKEAVDRVNAFVGEGK
jgi:Na+-translocating ferredoxin:NAD+ oxidoreductase subunit G